jgi:hypothetical protein
MSERRRYPTPAPPPWQLVFFLLLRCVVFSTDERVRFYERQDAAKAARIDELEREVERLRSGEGKAVAA